MTGVLGLGPSNKRPLLGPPVYDWGSWSGTKQQKTLVLGPPVYDWGSWSGTKQLKSLDMSRAPGHGPGYPCLGHGLILGLVPWWIRPQKCSGAT
jgi:hypothetical protein